MSGQSKEGKLGNLKEERKPGKLAPKLKLVF
jgi:hypothetical protein